MSLRMLSLCYPIFRFCLYTYATLMLSVCTWANEMPFGYSFLSLRTRRQCYQICRFCLYICSVIAIRLFDSAFYVGKRNGIRLRIYACSVMLFGCSFVSLRMQR